MKNMKMTIVGIVIAIFSVQVSFAQRVLIKNVNVIDVERGEVQEGRDLSIENGVIQAISPTKKYRKKEENTTLIDGAGKYVIPGFIDTHVHTAMGPANVSFDGETPHLTLTPLEELPAITAKLLLQHGVTTARDPGGKTEITVQTKMDLLNGKMEGPELMVAGNIIDTTEFTNMVVKVSNEEEILSEIRKQKTAGVDFIKLYTSLSPQLLKSGIEESHKLGLQTIAHLHGTSWTEASNLGIDNIVHIVPGHERYLPEADRAAYQQASLMGSFSFYKWFEYVDLNSDEIAELIQTLKSNNTSIDPTLVVFHATFFGNKQEYVANPMLGKLPSELVENWKTAFNFNMGWTEKHFSEAQKTWPKVQQFVKLLHGNGIMLTAGTDTNNPWVVPGDSFHKELTLLKNCGLSNAEVLKIATLNGAKLLGIDNRVGKIEEGKEADLVLLNTNPLEDISHSQDINLVLSNGMVVD